MSETGAPSSWDVIVVGAGITGLAVAFELTRRGRRVLLLEASQRVGGAILTIERDGWLFELGPNTVLNKPPLARLIEAAELEDEVVEATPSAKRRYIWKGNQLETMPAGLGSLLHTKLFSLGDKLKLIREPWVGRRVGDDESIASFVRRRLGEGLLNYAVGPFVSGVYAGDPERLSVRWAVPRISALETQYGSLIRGAIAERKGPNPAGKMISLRGGLRTLTWRLAERAGDVRTSVRVDTLEGTDSGYRVSAGEKRFEAPQLVLATPADATAHLLSDLTAGRSRELAEIDYAPMAIVGLGYRAEDVVHPLDGFGFLAPRIESLRILGCLFSSTMFGDHAPEGHVALTAFVGGQTDRRAIRLEDDELVGLVKSDLHRALGVFGDPVICLVHRWPRAIPQYEVGHGRFVSVVEEIEVAHPGLVLAGSFTGGVSIPDCASRAETVVDTLGAGGVVRTAP